MDHRLIVIGRRSYLGGHFTEYAQARHPRTISLSSKDCDLLDREQVVRFFRSIGRDRYTIVVFAVINKSVENSFAAFIDNVAMVKNLIDGAALANIESLVYLSSVDVYGNRPRIPITEESKINPDTWYGLAKYCCERLLLFSDQVTYPVMVLRIPGVYGNAPRDKSVIGRMVSSVRNGKPVPVSGDGGARRDYVHVDDLCRILDALIPLRCRKIVNIATGQSRPILEMAQVVGTVLRKKFSIERQVADPQRDFDLVFDTRTLRSLLPGFQFTSLEEGIHTYLGERPSHG
jgi:nucleoside-diphosphate-sugar epimerase